MIELLEKNTCSKLFDNSLGDEFLDLTPKANVTKPKTKKWDYIKLNSFCKAKKTIRK